MPHQIRRLLTLSLLVVVVACTGPASGAPPRLQDQYLQAARTAGQRIGLEVSDEDWLRIADLVCSRPLNSEADYQQLLEEIEAGPDPGRIEVMRDVARTAISLFCPP